MPVTTGESQFLKLQPFIHIEQPINYSRSSEIKQILISCEEAVEYFRCYINRQINIEIVRPVKSISVCSL